MGPDLYLRVASAAVVLTTALISARFRRSARTTTPVRRADEPVGLKLIRAVFGLSLIVYLVLVLVAPERVAWSLVRLPIAARGAGLVVAAAMIPALLWMFQHLGRNVTATTFVKERHELVISGPYRCVRHPLYTFTTLLWIGLGGALGSWLLIALAFTMVAVWSTVVIPREEAALEERFGDAYRGYARRVGRLVPRRAR